MLKIVTIVGARPQFIKAAAVSRALARAPGARELLVHTGQHYDENMSQVFFDELEIPPPAHHLAIGPGSPAEQTGRILIALDAVLRAEAPDWVLVYGDTTSTLAGALAAAKQHLPIAHVEAGVRSFNRRMPEEINRVLTDHAADLLLAPTRTAVENLRREGIAPDRIELVGDVMYDVALHSAAKADRASTILRRLEVEPDGYALATVHRAENTDDPQRLAAIFDGLGQLSRRLPVILPLHPRTRGALERQGLLAGAAGRLRLIDPVGYLDMIALERHARLIATDSGGVQKEAFFYRVPCLTLRDETEWTELVDEGANRLSHPLTVEAIVAAAQAILDGQATVGSVDAQSLYGDGHAAEAIVHRLAGGPAKR